MTEENLRFLKSGHKNGGVDRSRTDLCDFADRCLTVWLPRLVCFLIYTNYCKCQGFFWKKTKTFQEKKAAAKFLGKFYDSRERFYSSPFSFLLPEYDSGSRRKRSRFSDGVWGEPACGASAEAPACSVSAGAPACNGAAGAPVCNGAAAGAAPDGGGGGGGDIRQWEEGFPLPAGAG